MSERSASDAGFAWKHRLEFLIVKSIVWVMGALPRALARRFGGFIGIAAYHGLSRLRRVGQQNLALAMPERCLAERSKILKASYRNLGYHLVEFCRMGRYDRDEVERLIQYEGFENFQRAEQHGKGVFVLTGHLGSWELSSFYHSLMGHPMDMIIRRLDNPLVDQFVNAIRCQHGNRVLHKDDFARGLIASMRAGRVVGVLMDTNMTPPQGVFVPFFGVQACTASGVARVALRTGAAVLPGFLLWRKEEERYVLHFGKEVQLVNTGDSEADAVANTACFTRILEEYVRSYPEQWLWMHRRWKTRPLGEAGLYTP